MNLPDVIDTMNANIETFSEKIRLLDTDIETREKDIQRLREQRASFQKNVHNWTAARNLIKRDQGLAADGTLPIEGPKLPDVSAAGTVLFAAYERSDSKNNTFHEIEVKLFDRNVVLTCDCHAWRFTRGVISNGERENCKHIERFRRTSGDWITQAAFTLHDLGFRHRHEFEVYTDAGQHIGIRPVSRRYR